MPPSFYPRGSQIAFQPASDARGLALVRAGAWRAGAMVEWKRCTSRCCAG